MFRAAPCSMGKAGLKKVQLTNQPTRACTTGPSTTAVRTTDRSIIVVRTGGLPITGVRIGGDEDDRAETTTLKAEASLGLGRGTVLDGRARAVSSIADAQVGRTHELAPGEPAAFP
jgi:hypothetical protein